MCNCKNEIIRSRIDKVFRDSYGHLKIRRAAIKMPRIRYSFFGTSKRFEHELPFSRCPWCEDSNRSSGLKDINNREIVQGNWIRYIYEDRQEPKGYGVCIGEVCFERGCFVVRQLDFDYEKSGEKPMCLWEWLEEKCEVVG